MNPGQVTKTIPFIHEARLTLLLVELLQITSRF